MKNYRRNLISVFLVALFTTLLFTSCPPEKTPSTGTPKSLTMVSDVNNTTYYYYLDGVWYRDRACTKKATVELEKPASLTTIITLDFNGGEVDNSLVSLSAENTENDVSVKSVSNSKSYDFVKGKNELSWDFKKFKKQGSDEDFFNGELVLPEKGITENVTLYAEYDNTEYRGTLPRLTKSGLTFKGYTYGSGQTQETSTPIVIKNSSKNQTYKAQFVNDSVKTLTLKIEGKDPQYLYYGTSEKAWFSAFDGDGALQENNKIQGTPKFNIPTSPIWTVALQKNTPSGASDDDFKFEKDGNIAVESLSVKAELSLINENNTSGEGVINKTTGDVKVSEIIIDTVINGTYKDASISESVVATSSNNNYVFREWIDEDGTAYADLASVKVKGNTVLKASWENIAEYKLLRVLDNGGKVDTAYYNTNDGKWYERESTTILKNSIKAPNLKEKTYKVTFNYDNGSVLDTKSIKSKFLGYGLPGNDSPAINVVNETLSLNNYVINDNTTLESKWESVTIEEPTDIEKDGYKLDSFVKDGSTYDFSVPLDSDITIKAEWRAKEYNTLTLNIEGKEQKKLYYGKDDNSWYKSLSDNNLLLKNNRIEGEVSFDIPQKETLKVTFDKNVPSGAKGEDFSLSAQSVEVEAPLVLYRENVIDTSGKVLVSTLDASLTINGKYQAVKLGTTVKATTSNSNYEFKEWVSEYGKSISDLSEYIVSGNTTIKASWNNISDFKVLTVKDNDSIIDTAYYNTKDSKWYESEGTEKEKNKVSLPSVSNLEKIYTITLDYDDGNKTSSTSVLRSKFEGYGTPSGENKISTDGTLASYTIDNDTTLYSKWSVVKYSRPTLTPSKDGYTFEKWSVDGTNEYNFDSAVTGDVTIKAIWTKKTYKTLTLNIEGSEQHLYYGSDKEWYKTLGDNNLLLDENKALESERKFDIPKKNQWTVTLETNAPQGMEESDFSLTKRTILVSPVLRLSDESLVDKDTGSVKVKEITTSTIVKGDYPSQKVGENVEASSSNKNYVFNAWLLSNGTSVGKDGLVNTEIKGDTIIKATWTYNAEFFTLSVTDSGRELDKAYYNKTDNKWYSSANINSTIKTSVRTPDNKVNNYKVTLDYADEKTGKFVDKTLTSSFVGYGELVGKEGSLSSVSIGENTTLASKWEVVTYQKPSDPERDGYTFSGWFNGGVLYDFGTRVSSDITLVATWNRKTYKALTLNIDAKGYSKTLYYGNDNAWYKALGVDNLLLDDNRVKEGETPFDIPLSPTWTVTFDKGTPDGAKDEEIRITQTSIQKTPTLTLVPSDVVSSDGKILKAINVSTTVNGTYHPVQIGEDVVASSTNENFEFKNWLVTKSDGTRETLDESAVSSYEISSDVVFKAIWDNKSDVKTLRVYDGDVLMDTAYYNINDKKWYSTNDEAKLTEQNRKDNVLIPTSIEKKHKVTLDYNRGSEELYDVVDLPRYFKGYESTDKTVNIPSNGSLDGVEITVSTDLTSAWTDAKYVGLNIDPSRDGYELEKWVLKDDESQTPFDFDNNKVESDILLQAIWKEKTYKTLTLSLPGVDDQKRYYGSDGAWYRALSEDNLLLNENKIDNIRLEKFTLPTSPKWTATINVNPPEDAPDKSKFSASRVAIVKTPTLTLSDESVIDKSTGAIKIASINADNLQISGEYKKVKLLESVSAKSTDSNYAFKGWSLSQSIVSDDDLISLIEYEISSDVDIYAIWGSKSAFNLLTVMDENGATVDTAYYNIADRKWYNSASVQSGVKTNVKLPDQKTKEYTVTIGYNNGNTTEKTLTSSFNGYGNRGEIRADGSLSSYSISVATTLKPSWSEVKVSEPQPTPTRDGYTFDKWVKGDETKAYDFSTSVTESITLNALWNKKTYKTLTLTLGDSNQYLYYGSDGAWYKALGNDSTLLGINRVAGRDVKFNIESQGVLITFDIGVPKGANSSDFTLSHSSLYKSATLTLDNEKTIDKTTGVVSVSSIAKDTIITGTYSEIKVGENVRATSSNKNWAFKSWVKVNSDGNEEDISDQIEDYVVNGPTTIKATWENKASFVSLTLKDKSGNVKSTLYYNSTDEKWYDGNDIVSAKQIDKAPTPEKTSITYTVTFKVEDAVYTSLETTPSEFMGYFLAGAINTSVDKTGSLSNYRISEATELSEKWSVAKAIKPTAPTSEDGKVFDKWTTESGDEYDFDKEVSSVLTLVAKWADVITITLKDGDTTLDTVYYHPNNENKWTSDKEGKVEKTNVTLPASNKKEYKVTFNADGGSVVAPQTLESSFKGYANSEGVKIGEDGAIPNDYEPTSSETLQALWNEVKAKKPENEPTRDGYTFEKWYIEGDTSKGEYNFATSVTEDITLVASWMKKTYFTLKIDEKTFYYGSDSVWYKDLGGDNNDLLLEANVLKENEKKLTKPEGDKSTITVDFDGGEIVPYGIDEDTREYLKTENIEWEFLRYSDADKKVVIESSDNMTLPDEIESDVTLSAKFNTSPVIRHYPYLKKDGYIQGHYDVKRTMGDTTEDLTVEVDNTREEDPNSLSISHNTTYIITATWIKKTANTLTLNTTSATGEALAPQTLYYGSDKEWYSCVETVDGVEDLLLDKNKLTGGDVKFTLPPTPTWTITVNENIPAGAKVSEIIVPSIDAKTPEFSLTTSGVAEGAETIVEKTTGKILKGITTDVTIIGTYSEVKIGEVTEPSSNNVNFKFKNWKVKKEGDDAEIEKTNEDLADYVVKGNVTLTAEWENLAKFAKVEFKGSITGESLETLSTAYYNKTDKKWYVEETIASNIFAGFNGDKLKVQSDYYEVNCYENDSDSTPIGKAKNIDGLFDGFNITYKVNEEEKTFLIFDYTIYLPKRLPDEMLSDDMFTKGTPELISYAYWTDVKLEKPSDPTKDGYAFKGWKLKKDNGDLEDATFDFDTRTINGDCSLCASWEQKKEYKTLTIGEVVYYYCVSDNAWYSEITDDGLFNESKKVTDVKSLTVPSPLTATVTVNFDKGVKTEDEENDGTLNDGINTIEWEYTGYGVDGGDVVISALDLALPKNGISNNEVYVATYDKTAKSFTLPYLKKDEYYFYGYNDENGNDLENFTQTINVGETKNYTAKYYKMRYTLTIDYGNKFIVNEEGVEVRAKSDKGTTYYYEVQGREGNRLWMDKSGKFVETYFKYMTAMDFTTNGTITVDSNGADSVGELGDIRGYTALNVGENANAKMMGSAFIGEDFKSGIEKDVLVYVEYQYPYYLPVPSKAGYILTKWEIVREGKEIDLTECELQTNTSGEFVYFVSGDIRDGDTIKAVWEEASTEKYNITLTSYGNLSTRVLSHNDNKAKENDSVIIEIDRSGFLRASIDRITTNTDGIMVKFEEVEDITTIDGAINDGYHQYYKFTMPDDSVSVTFTGREEAN